ncbi:hypothetical protein [Actinoplanes rectilineatus]|uniref:hypothetical protein n=1 Tax=Actinoplanes rectilineatus TaxID=113571 RepID=UPI0005F2ADB9|nr:hypothetical protein [Actinoplanes rectilineatus]
MIPISREPLPAEVGSRMPALTGRIEDMVPVRRAEAARKLWRSSAERLAVVDPIRTVLQAMLRQAGQPGAAIVFAEMADIVPVLCDRRVRGALLRPSDG